jgi:hypothetical protein
LQNDRWSRLRCGDAACDGPEFPSPHDSSASAEIASTKSMSSERASAAASASDSR